MFSEGYGFEGISEADSAAQLDLDEDEGVGLDVQTLELRFRALLAEDGAERLELARA